MRGYVHEKISYYFFPQCFWRLQRMLHGASFTRPIIHGYFGPVRDKLHAKNLPYFLLIKYCFVLRSYLSWSFETSQRMLKLSVQIRSWETTSWVWEKSKCVRMRIQILCELETYYEQFSHFMNTMQGHYDRGGKTSRI